MNDVDNRIFSVFLRGGISVDKVTTNLLDNRAYEWYLFDLLLRNERRDSKHTVHARVNNARVISNDSTDKTLLLLLFVSWPQKLSVVVIHVLHVKLVQKDKHEQDHPYYCVPQKNKQLLHPLWNFLAPRNLQGD